MTAEELFEIAQQKRNNGNITEAVDDYQKVRKIALKTGNHWLAAESWHMIGVAFKQEGNFTRAKEALQQAQKEFSKLGDDIFVGAVLRDLGDVAFHQKDLIPAKDFLNRSIKTLTETANLGHLGMSKVKLGVILATEGQLAEGEAKVKEGLLAIEKSPDKFFESTACLDLALIQKQNGKKEEASWMLKRAEQLLNELGGPDQFLARRRQIAQLKQEIKN